MESSMINFHFCFAKKEDEAQDIKSSMFCMESVVNKIWEVEIQDISSYTVLKKFYYDCFYILD